MLSFSIIVQFNVFKDFFSNFFRCFIMGIAKKISFYASGKGFPFLLSLWIAFLDFRNI